MTRTSNVTLTQLDADTWNIWASGEHIGYIERDVVYVFEHGVSRRIGTIEHRSEVAALVNGWRKGVS